MPFNFAIDEPIVAAVRANAIFALNLSGGKDSTMAAHAANAMLDELGHDPARRIAIHADLGRAEWKSTPGTVEQQAREIGLPLVIAKREAGDMVARFNQRYEQGWDLYAELKLAILRGPWATSGSRFCTAEMKRDVIHRKLHSLFPGETIVSVLGIRHAESPKRSKTPVSKVDAKLARADGTNGILWHPAVHVATPDVFAYHGAHKLTLHEAYQVWGASRLSCAFCILASKGDITISANVPDNLDLYRLLVDMELATGFSFQQGGWLCDVAPAQLTAEQFAQIRGAKAYATERGQAEARISRDYLKACSTTFMPLPSIEDAEAIATARRFNAAWTGRPLDYLTGEAVRERLSLSLAA